MTSRFMNTLFGSRRRAGIAVLLWIILVAVLASAAPRLGGRRKQHGCKRSARFIAIRAGCRTRCPRVPSQ